MKFVITTISPSTGHLLQLNAIMSSEACAEWRGMSDLAEYSRPVAWLIGDWESQRIIHACSEEEAAEEAERDWDMELKGREPEWDGVEFTAREAMSRGWWWQCRRCGHQLYLDDGCPSCEWVCDKWTDCRCGEKPVFSDSDPEAVYCPGCV